MTTIGKYKGETRPSSRPSGACYNTNNNFGREHENPFEIDLSFRPVDFTAFGKCRNQGFRHNFSSYAEWEKTYGLVLSSTSDSSDSDSDSDSKNESCEVIPATTDNKLQEELLRTTQLVYSYQDGRGMVPKLREPRNLYALAKEFGPQQSARWPSEIQVLEEKVRHIRYIPPSPEPFYKQHGQERMPMVRGEERGANLVYMYQPRSSFRKKRIEFVRSRVRGCRSGPSQCAPKINTEEDTTLIFESRFESGNLAKACQVGVTNDYEMWLRYDLYTNKHIQWYYFRVSNTRANVKYRFTIVNFIKSDSLYNYGMKPLMYSEKEAQTKKVGWIRSGSDIKYYRNNIKYETTKGEKPFYSLTWTVEFPHDNDTVYFAHCFPYTYTDLQDYLLDITNDPVKSKICKQRVLCRTLAGNLVYVLTITSPSQNPEDIKHKKAVVITSRVHPGECNASWMMKGFLDYLTGSSADAKLLRDTFIFKIVPMLNPDGVIVGNYRCSLAGRDLNRNYKTVLKDSYPSVWHTKNMIRKLLQEREIIVYCDLHGHSRKQNVFIYGCDNRHNPEKRLRERIFPVMLNKNAPDKFKFESCKFKVQKSKEGTGRIVMWHMGIMNSYTMEATFCGSTIGKKKGYHFTLLDFEAMGYHFCDTLLDYCDPDNTKCANVLLELEDKMKRDILAKLQRAGISPNSADDIDLSDDFSSLESSDGGSDSSVSDGPPVHLQFAPQREDIQVRTPYRFRMLSQQQLKKKKKLKTKKERDRVRSFKDDTKKVSSGDRPASDHVCDKKAMSGHQTAHAKQDKGSKPVGFDSSQTAQSMKYTSAQRRPKSYEERPSTTTSATHQEKLEDKNPRRNEYLEALTNAYLRNGLLNSEAGVTLRTKKPVVGSTLVKVWKEHMQRTRGRQSNIDDLVRSQITHQASISPINRQPLQRHILEVSAAQQRQQDILQQSRKQENRSGNNVIRMHPNPFDDQHTSKPPITVCDASKSGRPRTQVPSATFVNYDQYHSAKAQTEEPQGESKEVLLMEVEKLEPLSLDNQDDESKESKKHKGKHKEKGGRKSRMGMRESDEDHGAGIEGPDYVTDPHTRKEPRVKSAQSTEEVDSAIESIKELRQSLATTAIQQNLSPTAGLARRYIKRLMKETDHDIDELTNEIKSDIEYEKKLAKRRSGAQSASSGSTPVNGELSPICDSNIVPVPEKVPVSRSHHKDLVLLRENNGLGLDLPDENPKWLQDTSVTREKKTSSRQRIVTPMETKTNYPVSDRTHDRVQKWSNDSGVNNYSNNNAQPPIGQKKLSDMTFDLSQVHYTEVPTAPQNGSVSLSHSSTQVGSSYGGRKPVGEPLKLAECSSYTGQSFVKCGKGGMRVGSATSSSSREEKNKYPNSDKYFELTNRAKSAKSSRGIVGKMFLRPIISETVPTKIQLMISQSHQEEKTFGGQFLPLSRTIRAPFYRNNKKNPTK
ncbi:cytosolic carboxypeptidase 2-like isoform X22 [Mizuhopecten yessoensis]|uniref:cytosolic carboxypeptidase 2-like isoform X22 n=1 Tax=Mizuhopecten yessoensis TaxID=6573 RepID=UPI000B45B0A7|nr:cytosolic carboxypeptidase 2-like isoform X22 [Mizuhopecten yessoensis]